MGRNINGREWWKIKRGKYQNHAVPVHAGTCCPCTRRTHHLCLKEMPFWEQRATGGSSQWLCQAPKALKNCNGPDQPHLGLPYIHGSRALFELSPGLPASSPPCPNLFIKRIQKLITLISTADLSSFSFVWPHGKCGKKLRREQWRVDGERNREDVKDMSQVANTSMRSCC